MALDLQQRQTRHGNRRYHTRHETENGRVVLRLDPTKNRGITQSALKKWLHLKGKNQLPKLIEGVIFKDGIEIINAKQNHAA
jgi:hypothetical protein